MTTTISPSLGHGILMTQAGVGTTPGYDAIDVRRMVAAEQGEGVQSYESFRVRQRGAGANMSVDIGMNVEAFVRGDAVTLQGLYTVAPHSATINEVIGTADPTNPRLDQVILELKDTTHDASGANLAQTRVVTGTPTGGATLDNRTGAAAMPVSAILLADVLVPALDTTIEDAQIRDRRPFVVGVPPLLTDVDMVSLGPVPGLLVTNINGDQIVDLAQYAYAVQLPKRVVGATRLRWKYRQNPTTALTGNYIFGIYDASGRRIVDTGSVAFTGAAATFQTRAETIAATTFEPGLYYVLFGADVTNAGDIDSPGVLLEVTTANAPTPHIPNVALHSASGGVTAPNALLAFSDVSGLGSLTARVVPLIGLSVG